ncbi:MAG: hypothetical protein ACLGHN_10950 [Bacteriovoracia bacterium]
MKIFKSLSVFMMVFSLFLTSVVPANVHAVTVEDYKVERTEADQVLKDIFDRFHYALSVEWDQKDPEFRKNAEMELKKALKDSGLSTEQIQGFLTREILSGKIGQEYSRLLEAMKGAELNQEEASQLARDFMKITYSQGTSFNGDGVHHGNWKYVVTVVVVVVVTALIIGSLKGGKDHDDDHDHGCHYDCTDIVVVN